MPTDVIMPVLGMNQDTAVLLAWRKREGDTVTEGEPLMEVETDKATMELEAPASGTLARVSVADGAEVPVGSVIAVILADGEASDGTPAPAGGAAAASGAQPQGAARPPAETPPQTPAQTPAQTAAEPPPAPPAPAGATAEHAPAGLAPRGEGGRVLASPKARRLAQERGIDLGTLSGSGPEGAVLAADVPAAGASPAPASLASVAGPASALTLERHLAADGLLDLLERARAHGAPEAELGDLLVRFATAVWRRHPLTDAAPPLVSYRRRADDGLQHATVPADAPPGLATIVAARTDAGAAGPARADLAVWDLTGSAIDRMVATVDGAALTVVAGRHRATPGAGGAPAAGLELSLAFDAARVDAGAAVDWAERLFALLDDPSQLIVLY